MSCLEARLTRHFPDENAAFGEVAEPNAFLWTLLVNFRNRICTSGICLFFFIVQHFLKKSSNSDTNGIRKDVSKYNILSSCT